MTEIERLADVLIGAFGNRALHDTQNEDPPGDDVLVDGYFDPKAVVRAILQAMREPAASTLQALWTEYPPPMYDQGGDPAAVWKAGIDHILSEAP